MAKNAKLPEAADFPTAHTGSNGAAAISPTAAEPLNETPILDEHNPVGDTPYDPPVDRHASAYAVALGQLDRVADFMQLDDDMRVYLSTCQRELIVHFPVQMDDGKGRMFTGFRVHHTATKGACRVELRYHP